MCSLFLVAAEAPITTHFASRIEALSGKELTSITWIVPWNGTADALCRTLKTFTRSRIVVCSTSTDWSYR